MVSACMVQYSTVLCQKLFWVVSNLYLYHTYYVREKTLVCYPPPNFGSLLLTPPPCQGHVNTGLCRLFVHMSLVFIMG